MKTEKSLDEFQFFKTIEKCTFCIMNWLVNIVSKQNFMRKLILKLSILDTKLYELFNNRLIILQNFM